MRVHSLKIIFNVWCCFERLDATSDQVNMYTWCWTMIISNILILLFWNQKMFLLGLSSLRKLKIKTWAHKSENLCCWLWANPLAFYIVLASSPFSPVISLYSKRRCSVDDPHIDLHKIKWQYSMWTFPGSTMSFVYT